MMDAIGQELGGAGDVIVVEGIAGSPIVAMQADGRNAALAKYPDLNVVATVNGDWTPTTTKNVILQTLATNPAEIDAVWTSGSESRLVAEAFKESGREVPLVTGSISGDGLGYWRENPDGYRFTGNAVLPVPTANSAFRIAMRTLEGQGPKLNTLLVDLPKVTQADLPAWARDCMTPDSADGLPRGADGPVSRGRARRVLRERCDDPPVRLRDHVRPLRRRWLTEIDWPGRSASSGPVLAPGRAAVDARPGHRAAQEPTGPLRRSNSVSVDFRAGTVHTVLGENGYVASPPSSRRSRAWSCPIRGASRSTTSRCVGTARAAHRATASRRCSRRS